MATFKTVLRTTKEYNKVYIRISHRSNVDYIPTSMICHKSMIRKGEISDSTILANGAIMIKSYIERINNLNIKNWTVQNIKKFLMSSDEDISFTDFATEFIIQMKNENRDKPAANYKSALNSLLKYAKREKLFFSDITTSLMNSWIKSLSNSTINKDMFRLQL